MATNTLSHDTATGIDETITALHPETGLSPRMAKLKRAYDEAAATERAVHLASEADENDAALGRAWDKAFDNLCAIALDIFREPVASAADFTFKAAVWDRCCEGISEDDDLTSHWGWMDRAPLRLVSDARKLLAVQAA